MKDINEKLQIIECLNKAGFKKELISYVLLRIEEFNEDLGYALWNGMQIAAGINEENVENKENVA